MGWSTRVPHRHAKTPIVRRMTMPTNVGILVFDDVEVLDFCGPFEVFSVTRSLGVPTTDETQNPFNVFLIAERPGIIKARGNLKVQPDYTLDDSPAIDILVVPGGQGTR